MEISRQLITLWGATVVLWNPVARAVEPPLPTPTPRPGTLAALAGKTNLHRSPGVGAADPILITDENLAELADGAVVTVLTSTIAEPSTITGGPEVDAKTRDKWRKRVFAQSKVIARAEAKRDAIETEIDRLERGRLDSRTLDRIAKAETKLRLADNDIKREKAELSRIVREARKEGAQPGWFR